MKIVFLKKIIKNSYLYIWNLHWLKSIISSSWYLSSWQLSYIKNIRCVTFQTFSIHVYIWYLCCQLMAVWIKRYIDFACFFPAFPVIHSSTLVTHDVVNNYSLLYKVQGSNSALRPYMLCAHLDVVPVNRDAWEEDPFGANIKDGFIYARGTIDVKQIVMVCLYNVKICDASKLASICKFTIIDKIADYFIACWCIGFTSVVLLRGRLIANER